MLLSDGGCNQGASVTCKRKGAFVMPLVHVSAKHFAMESCVLIPRRGHGVVARSGIYRNNLVYHSATGFALGGSADARYNVVFSVRDMGKNLDYTDEDAHFGVWSTSQLVLVGNRGACSTGPSYRFSSFNMPPAHFHNNSAHCANLGLTIKGSHTSPVQDISLWRIRHIALWGYVSSDSPTFDNVRLADFSVGLLWGGLGADSAEHTVRMQTLLVSNSLFLGRSSTNPSCFEQVGILLPIFGTAGFSISPSTCGPLGGHWTKGIFGVEHPTGSNPTLAAETRVTGTSFLQFEERCGSSFVMMTLMRGGMESADAVPPIFFDETTIDATSQARLAYLPPPKRDWIAPTKCVVMDCDGPKHVLIHDLDGSLMGQGADASILARAEFMHQTRADSSEFTWYMATGLGLGLGPTLAPKPKPNPNPNPIQVQHPVQDALRPRTAQRPGRPGPRHVRLHELLGRRAELRLPPQPAHGARRAGRGGRAGRGARGARAPQADGRAPPRGGAGACGTRPADLRP